MSFGWGAPAPISDATAATSLIARTPPGRRPGGGVVDGTRPAAGDWGGYALLRELCRHYSLGAPHPRAPFYRPQRGRFFNSGPAAPRAGRRARAEHGPSSDHEHRPPNTEHRPPNTDHRTPTTEHRP